MRNAIYWSAVFGLCLSALAAPEPKPAPKPDFNKTLRETMDDVNKRARAADEARRQARRDFVFGLREGGSTFGYGQVPVEIKEPQLLDDATLAAAKAKLRAALPETLTEADEVRLLEGELKIEERAGGAAGRSEVVRRLSGHLTSLPACKTLMRYHRDRRDYVALRDLAHEIERANATNLPLRAFGLACRRTACARLNDVVGLREARLAMDALPLTDEIVKTGYLTLLDDRTQKSADFTHLIENISQVKDRRVRRWVYQGLFYGACNACDYAEIKKWAAKDAAEGGPEMLSGRASDAMMRLRCWNDAVDYGRVALKFAAQDPNAQLRLARACLAAGLFAEAQTNASALAANEKAKPKQRFVGRVLALLATTKPEGLKDAILALEKTSGAKDGAEFAEFVLAANSQALEPLMTSERSALLIGARQAMLALLHPEERVVADVRYRPNAPRTAALADAEGLFDPKPGDPWKVENRFAPYQTYSWTQRRAVFGNLKCNPKPDLVGVRGEGRSAEIVSFYDESGVHVYMRFRDPGAAKFALGEAPACGIEFTVQPDDTKGWNQIFTKTDATDDLNHVQWDSVEYGHKPTFDVLRVDSTTTDTAYLFHVFVPWTHAYTRLPKDGDTWNTVLCASLPSGTFVLGGGAVHELGRGMKLRFAMDAKEARLVRRALVRRAAGDFLRWRAQWKNAYVWKDEVLGDPQFWDGVVAKWLEARESAAKALVRRADADVSDAESEELSKKYLRDWIDPRLALDDLRADWLRRDLFR